MAAIDELLMHRAELLGYLRKQGATPEQAEDVLQSALLRGLEPWARLPPTDKLVPWFYRVLRNAFIDTTRRSATSQRALERYAEESDASEDPPEPRRICGCARRLLVELKPEYATLVERVDVDNVPIDELARELGITANNAYVRLHRARRALRTRLEAFCGTCCKKGGHGDCYCGAS